MSDTSSQVRNRNVAYINPSWQLDQQLVLCVRAAAQPVPHVYDNRQLISCVPGTVSKYVQRRWLPTYLPTYLQLSNRFWQCDKLFCLPFAQFSTTTNTHTVSQSAFFLFVRQPTCCSVLRREKKNKIHFPSSLVSWQKVISVQKKRFSFCDTHIDNFTFGF